MECRLWEGSSKHCWNIFSNARLQKLETATRKGENIEKISNHQKVTSGRFSFLPEDRQVRCLHQHLHQGIHHLCVEDDGVHHFTQLLVVRYTEACLRNASVSLGEKETNASKKRGKKKQPKCFLLCFYLQPEPVQSHPPEVKHISIFH